MGVGLLEMTFISFYSSQTSNLILILFRFQILGLIVDTVKFFGVTF